MHAFAIPHNYYKKLNDGNGFVLLAVHVSLLFHHCLLSRSNSVQCSSIIMLLLLLCVWPSRHRVSTWYSSYGLGQLVPVVI